MARQTVELQRPERWDNPFSPDMTRAEVDRVLDLPPLNEIEPGNFPSTASLRDVIRNDTRIRRFARGDIVVRQGDYGNSAFFVLSGTARVILQPQLRASISLAVAQGAARYDLSSTLPLLAAQYHQVVHGS